MKKVILSFLFLFGVFSIGIFGGEWLIDQLFSSTRDSMKTEIIQSIFIGFFVALLFIFSNKILKGKHK